MKEVVPHDSGSTILGFSLGCLALEPPAVHSPAPARVLFVSFAAALPLLDLLFGIVRRTLAGRSPFFGDRAHICDLLLRLGWSPRHVALACYGATAALIAMGWIALRAGTPAFAAVSVLAISAMIAIGWRLGALRLDEDVPTPTTPGEKKTMRVDFGESRTT